MRFFTRFTWCSLAWLTNNKAGVLSDGGSELGGEVQFDVDVQRGFWPRRDADRLRRVSRMVSPDAAEFQRQPATALGTGCSRSIARGDVGEIRDAPRSSLDDDPCEAKPLHAPNLWPVPQPDHGKRVQGAFRSLEEIDMARHGTQAGKKSASTPTTRQRPSDRQVLVRLSSGEAEFLSAVVPSKRERARYLRRLLTRAKARHEREKLRNMFVAAAKDMTDDDRDEGRAVVGAFSNRD